MLPNQVSYLKGFSMESFTLGPTPKIDFSCSVATAHLQWLERQISYNNLTNNSLSSDGIQYRILTVLSAQGPLFIGWGSNGRLQWNMRVPSGRWTWTVRTDNCATDFFENFAEKSFLFKSRVWMVRHSRPDGRTSAASNFFIRLRASGPWEMSVRTAKLQHAISIFAMHASGPW